jgi:hypothetical protein
MRDVFARLHHTKMVLSCIILVGVGISLLALGEWIPSSRWSGLDVVPWSELGGILIGAGVLSVWLDHFMRREQAEADELRLRTLLTEHAPAMRDAVLEAFAANHKDLERVATPEMLDRLIANSLALRLGDQQFASEIYTDIRDQAVLASERWYDASLSIDLSLPDVTGMGPKRGSAFKRDYFAVTVRWEYKVVPKHTQRRFVCLSDREEYTELLHERSGTSAWYLKPTGGLPAESQAAFELVRFGVDGQERPIRRSARKDSQTYTASVGDEVVRAGQPVTIAYTYRTITRQDGHLLFFDIEQPTRDLRVDFDYAGTGIQSVSTLDLVPTVRPARIERPAPGRPGETIRVDLDGWIFPRSGVAFVWSQ